MTQFIFCLAFLLNISSLAYSKEWSILICTLKERENLFNKLFENLKEQIKKNHLEDEVEVLYFLDDREYSIGFKRNCLMEQAQGEYVNFIDDDDEIHSNYVKMIYNKLKKKPDCVSLVGIITFNGKNPRFFVHSLKYDSYFEANSIYFRPPNHLNPMKRSIASQFKFPDISFGEDTDWAMQIARSKLLKTEETLVTPYYFYLFVDKKY